MDHRVGYRSRSAAISVLVVIALSPAGAAQAAPAMCADLPATIVGTSGPDHLIGTAGPDVIAAGYGHDRVEGQGGRDVVCAGPGHDLVLAGHDEDPVGGHPDDEIYGGYGHDRIGGAQGNDYLVGGPGDDRVNGADGTDQILGGYGHDVLLGDGTAAGFGGSDSILGGPGDDRLAGGPWMDTMDGGDGDDNLFGQYQADTFIDSGGGNDYFHAGPYPDDSWDRWVPPSAEGIYVNLTTGRARTAHGEETLHGFIEITGTAHDDVLIGDDEDGLYGHDRLYGAGGDDRIYGRGGRDQLSGYLTWVDPVPPGAGTDILVGGAGSDGLLTLSGRAIGGTGTDRVDLLDPAGLERDGAHIDLAAGSARVGERHLQLAGVENVEGTSGDDAILGDAGPNHLGGWDGNDILDGRRGRDDMDGWSGVDTCYVRSERDTAQDCEFIEPRAE